MKFGRKISVPNEVRHVKYETQTLFFHSKSYPHKIESKRILYYTGTRGVIFIREGGGVLRAYTHCLGYRNYFSIPAYLRGRFTENNFYKKSTLACRTLCSVLMKISWTIHCLKDEHFFCVLLELECRRIKLYAFE